jgi:hypothetical protein
MQPKQSWGRRTGVLEAAPVVLRPMRDRRDWASRDALLCRVRRDIEQTPFFSVSPAEASVRFSLAEDVCRRVLSQLEASGAIALRRDGRYQVRRRAS